MWKSPTQHASSARGPRELQVTSAQSILLPNDPPWPARQDMTDSAKRLLPQLCHSASSILRMTLAPFVVFLNAIYSLATLQLIADSLNLF